MMLARSFAIEITYKFYKDDDDNIAITVIVKKVTENQITSWCNDNTCMMMS